MSDPLLFEDTFTVTAINAQKYDRVSRIACTSTDQYTTFTLDVNTELYPCAVGEQLSLALASTLALDGRDDGASGKGGWRDVGMGEQTLANDYDYVCHGKVYRFEEGATAETMYVQRRRSFDSEPKETNAWKGPSSSRSEVCCFTWKAHIRS